MDHVQPSIVLVTGASGYLGGHIIRGLLPEYKVIGAVRSEAKGRKLVEALGRDGAWGQDQDQDQSQSQDHNQNFVPVVLNLQNPTTISRVIVQYGITAIIHTAAPYNFGLKDYVNGVINPIVRMMEALIQACRENPAVVRFVYTSAFSAHHTLEMYSNQNLSVDENSWCDYTYVQGLENPFKAYHYAKATAEHMFWDYAKRGSIGATAISPFFMFGPQPFDEYCLGPLNSSAQLFNIILSSGPDGLDDIPHLFGYVSDVRDVSKLHIQSLSDSNLWGHRLLPFSGQFTTAQILEIARTKFFLGSKLPPVFPMEVRLVRVNNGGTRDLVKWDLIREEDTISDSLGQILRVTESSSGLTKLR